MTNERKLLLGFGLISLTMLGLGGVSVVGMSSISKMSMTVYDQTLMASTFSQSASAKFFNIKEQFQRGRHLDEDARDEILESIEEEQVRLIEDLEVVLKHTQDRKSQEQLPPLIKNIHAWTAAQSEILEEGEPLTDEEKSGTIPKATKQIEDSMSVLVQDTMKTGFVSRVESEQQSRSLVITTVGATLSAFLIATGIALLICRPMLRRLSPQERIVQTSSVNTGHTPPPAPQAPAKSPQRPELVGHR